MWILKIVKSFLKTRKKLKNSDILNRVGKVAAKLLKGAVNLAACVANKDPSHL